ncbi:hypothetical protein [Marinobacterium stanieri]|uniref:Uncharacterized protein n=1 Tax=Marinobacterium stanieri TaxID=49186 RepID=A0A1N6XX87_9GAMM|nr:hypothetical protein [Marinobacterium stanieri]SIR06914.1 hypothetical protein SAMN05421647_1189 [Marinobacterium stanieri]
MMKIERPQAPAWYLLVWLGIALLWVGMAIMSSWVAWFMLLVCYPFIMKAVSWRPEPVNGNHNLNA